MNKMIYDIRIPFRECIFNAVGISIFEQNERYLRAKNQMHLNMFGLFAALNSFIPKERQGREALIYENDIRSGHGLGRDRIYRESSADRKARKELIVIRAKERIQQQIKFVRLMKKLLIQIEDIDEDFEQMREKVAQIEMKIEKAAREKQINCDEMFDLNKPDDDYDIQLEQLIQRVVLNETNNTDSKTVDKKWADSANASGDHADILSSSTPLR